MCLSSHGIGSLRTNISSICQIYNVINHIVIVCPRIEDLKPKCGKHFSHQIENYALRYGYYTIMGHIKDKCWKKGKDTKMHTIANNYLKMLMDDEATTLEQLNRFYGSKHDFFSEFGCLKEY
jgi:hypothetical protein